MRTTLTLCVVALLPLVGGCAGNNDRPAAGVASVSTPSKSLPAPAAELAPLAFMSGTWISSDAARGKPFNEEHWSTPIGSSMGGVFRRIRADGKPAFFEIVAITVEPEGTFLRLRHFHGRLDPREGETDAAVYRLAASSPTSAVFSPVTNTRGVSGVTYTLRDASTLHVRIEYEPGAKRDPEEFTMLRTR
jgi:hypothetical protein